MKKAELAKRPIDEAANDLTVESLINATFEFAAHDPERARAIKKLAEAQGVSYEVVVRGIVAAAYHIKGEPPPDELREYLAKHGRPNRSSALSYYLKLGRN